MERDGVLVGSLHPNHPGDWQDEVCEAVVVGEAVGVIEAVGDGEMTLVVVGSLQPNHPGVLQVDVDVEVVPADEVFVIVAVAVAVAVVDGSKHPHHPGVWQVEVLVLVTVVVGAELVVDSVPLLSKNFQLLQSTHSGNGAHSGTVSYFSRTSAMTARIR